MKDNNQNDKEIIRTLQNKLQKYEHLAIFPAFPQDTIVVGTRTKNVQGNQALIIGNYICPWRGYHLIYTTHQTIELVDHVYESSNDIEKK